MEINNQILMTDSLVSLFPVSAAIDKAGPIRFKSDERDRFVFCFQIVVIVKGGKKLI